MYYTYILKSEKDNKNYIGFTNNIEKRLNQHSQGIVKSTKNRRPLKLIHTEKFSDKKDAIKREKYYKTGAGREELKRILEK